MTNMSDIYEPNFFEKEENVTIYKKRLKELEDAFYYNLEIISERDLELSVLEKQLSFGNDQLQQTLQEKATLEKALRTIDKRNVQKIQRLESILNLREREIKTLQQENARIVGSLKKMADNAADEQSRKMNQMTLKFESDKKKLIDDHRKETEGRENYYLMQINNLTRKLEEVRREKNKFIKLEQENRSLKDYLLDLEKLFREKENSCSSEVKKKSRINKTHREVQCGTTAQVSDKEIQIRPNTADFNAQCFHADNNAEEQQQQEKKLAFLMEQNEVLKCVIKDLKKSKGRGESSTGANTGPSNREGCPDCKSAMQEIRVMSERFEKEINNLKATLHREMAQRADEEIALQSLEASMTCLKEKILSPLLKKSANVTGDSGSKSHGFQGSHKLSCFEEKLCEKIDLLIIEAKGERRKITEKLEEFKRECLDKIGNVLAIPCPAQDSWDKNWRNLLDEIRLEMGKFGSKIGSDVINAMGDGNWREKRESGNGAEENGGSRVIPRCQDHVFDSENLNAFPRRRKSAKRNDGFPENYTQVLVPGREIIKFDDRIVEGGKKKVSKKKITPSFFNGLLHVDKY